MSKKCYGLVGMLLGVMGMGAFLAGASWACGDGVAMRAGAAIAVFGYVVIVAVLAWKGA